MSISSILESCSITRSSDSLVSPIVENVRNTGDLTKFSNSFSSFLYTSPSPPFDCITSSMCGSSPSVSSEASCSISYSSFSLIGASVSKNSECCNEIEEAVDKLTAQMESACSFTYDYYNRLVEYMCSDDMGKRIESIRVFRQSLASKNNNKNGDNSNSDYSKNEKLPVNPSQLCDICIQDIHDAGLVPFIRDTLHMAGDNYELQLETVLFLNRLTSGTSIQTELIANSDVVYDLVAMLQSASESYAEELREAIFCVLTNITVDCNALKELITEQPNAINMITFACQLAPSVQSLKLCHALVSSSTPSYTGNSNAVIDFLVGCIKNCSDNEILCIACSACMIICESSHGASCILSTGVARHIVCLLESSNSSIIYEALAVIAKIAYVGSTEQINELINCRAVPIVVHLLENKRLLPQCTRARACNTLGNIGCETPSQVQSLIDANAFTFLVDLFRNESDYNTRIEAAYAVCAAVSRASQEQVAYIVSCRSVDRRSIYAGECNCMQLIADMLELVKASDPMNAGNLKLCKAILRGLENILNIGDEEGKNRGLSENPYAYMFNEVQGVVILSQMQFFPEYTVSTKTRAILDKYFAGSNVCCAFKE